MNPHSSSLSSFIDMSEAQPRKIHIWEFPEEFRVRLDEEMSRDLVNHAVKNVGGIRQLAHVLKIHVNTVYKYRAQPSFIPLSYLLQMCGLARDQFTVEQVEPHIVAYKGGHNAIPILNPKLPLVETPDLFAFMGHLIGDGGSCACEAYYTNSNETLIHEFLRLLRNVFGETHYRIRLRSNGTYKIGIGLTILKLLHHIYKLKFRTFTARVPQPLFELPREFAAAFLCTFGDDEGNVADGHIQLNSANKQLIQDICDLIRTKFSKLKNSIRIEECTIKRIQKAFYGIRIGANACADYRTLIGFNHPAKNQELNRILARRERGWSVRPHGSTRRMILEMLAASTSMTAKEIARKVNVTTGVTRRNHLHGKKGLIALGFVRVIGKKSGKGGPMIYDITELGRKFLQLPSIGLLSGRAGRTKVKILKTLTEGNILSEEIRREIDFKEGSLLRHMNGRRDRGKLNPGLIELGLVRQSRQGRKTDPYIYSLTKEGRKVFEELETLFPDI